MHYRTMDRHAAMDRYSPLMLPLGKTLALESFWWQRAFCFV